MPKHLFREKAIKRLSSPERLDTLIEVTTPRAWIVLLATASALVAVLVWGFLGVLSDTIVGTGIILHEGGIYGVQSAGSGIILEMEVETGDSVAQGQVIARIAQPDLEGDLEGRSLVRSPREGRILEVLVDRGEVIGTGARVALMDSPDRPLRATVFVPPEGKRIRPGMSVRLSPSGLTPEEYGYMLGSVEEVSELPVTPTLMNRYLRNQELVQEFAAGGNTYMVSVALEVDSATTSGFKWTGRSGPELKVGTGTILSALISVQNHRPITLVVPALRRWLGV